MARKRLFPYKIGHFRTRFLTRKLGPFEELLGLVLVVAKLQISDITFGHFQIVFVATKVDNFDETLGKFQAVGCMSGRFPVLFLAT